MDQADEATKYQEAQLERALKISRRETKKIKELREKLGGVCQFCREPLGKGEIFCDADCRDDHAKLARSVQMKPIVE